MALQGVHSLSFHFPDQNVHSESLKRIVFLAFFPSSPSPALSICWFCQSDSNSEGLSGLLTTFPGKHRFTQCRREATWGYFCTSSPSWGLLMFCSCLECKTQLCFSSPPIWMEMSSSWGSCQRRQQPPGASHTTLLRCALVSVGSGLCKTRLRCFSISSGIIGLMQLEKLCFLYICVYVDMQNTCI